MIRRWSLRLAFVGFALLALASRAARLAADRTAVETGLADRGLADLGLVELAPRLASLARLVPSPSPEMLAATVPGCPEALLVAPLRFNGSGFETAHLLFGSPARPRLVYLGLVGGPAIAPQLFGRWMAATLLHATGLRATPVPQSLVVVALPPACPTLRALDWSRLSPWV